MPRTDAASPLRHPPPAAPAARSFEARTTIARAPAEVWAALTDLAAMPRWVEGLREARVEGPGPPGAGARLVEVRQVGGRVREVPLAIEAWEPPRRLVRSARTPVGRVTYTYTLEPAPGGATRLTLRGEARPGGLGERVALALAWGQVRRDEALPERLRVFVEGR